MGASPLHYIDVLQDIVDSYNNTYHRSIGRAPATVNLLNAGQVRRKLYGKIERSQPKASSLKWVIMSDLVYENDSSKKGIKLAGQKKFFK